MVKEADGTKRYVHRDGKSNVVAVTTASGAVEHSFKMDAFGNGTDAAGSPYKFTSRRLDEETGLYYYRHRYYHTGLGRFMSEDPIGYGDGLNMYAYAHNDPINFRDPMGLSDQPTVVPDGGPGPNSDTMFSGHSFSPGEFSDYAQMKQLGGGGEPGQGQIPQGAPKKEALTEEIIVTAKRRKGIGQSIYQNLLFTSAEAGYYGFVYALLAPHLHAVEMAALHAGDGIEADHTMLWAMGATRLAKAAWSGVKWVGTSYLGSAGKLFGRHKKGLLNSNDYLRIGWSWAGSSKTGREVFRIAWGSKRSRIHGHSTLWPLRTPIFFAPFSNIGGTDE